MNNIFKYPVSLGEFERALPKDRRILSVQMQGDNPCLWAMVDSSSEIQKVKFIVRGTGHEFEPNTTQSYIGTFQMAGGGLIWHLFELK